jgi:ssDNA-binding replication factor A large subunit
MSEEATEIIKEISEKSGKSEDEIKELINAKIEKFSGLLTKQGAAFMVQKELGLKNESGTVTKISELNDGMKNIDVKGNVKIVFPPKEFERNGKAGKLSSFILEDGEGEIRVTLWNDQVDKYNLTTGSEIDVKNCVVSSYNDNKQISLGFNGSIEILKEAQVNFEKINDLKGGMRNVNIAGRILRKFPIKEFNSGEKNGKLCNFQFGDDTDLLRATAWNEKADEITNLNEGDIIEIKNAYTKNGMYGIELHLGYNTMVDKSDKDLPSAASIMKDNIEKKKINDLSENANVVIKGKISEIEQGKLYYNACEKCNKKVEVTTNGTICEKCGEVEGKINPIINITIEDDTASIKANFFGSDALKVLGMNDEDFEIMVNEKSSETIVNELNEKLKDKEIELFGYSKTDSYSGEFKFNTKEIIKA